MQLSPGARGYLDLGSHSAPFLPGRNDADRGHTCAMVGRRLLEQPTDGIFGNKVHRVRLEESGLECPRFRAGQYTPSTVGNLDPASMGGTQREHSFPEGMHDRRHPGAGFEPGTHGTHQSESRRIGELPPPASLMLDDRAPEGDRTDHWGRRPGRARAFEDVE